VTEIRLSKRALDATVSSYDLALPQHRRSADLLPDLHIRPDGIVTAHYSISDMVWECFAPVFDPVNRSFDLPHRKPLQSSDNVPTRVVS